MQDAQGVGRSEPVRELGDERSRLGLSERTAALDPLAQVASLQQVLDEVGRVRVEERRVDVLQGVAELGREALDRVMLCHGTFAIEARVYADPAQVLARFGAHAQVRADLDFDRDPSVGREPPREIEAGEGYSAFPVFEELEFERVLTGARSGEHYLSAAR
jgi:hypothetical protein